LALHNSQRAHQTQTPVPVNLIESGDYVLRIGAGVDLSDHMTWDIISYRYRNALDPNDDYNTPQVATGFTYKLDADTSVSAKIMRNWKDGEPSSTGVSLGLKKKF